MSDNDLTVKSYDDNVQKYVAGTPASISGDVKGWISRILALIPEGGSVLELGSGAGRDAKHIESLGYKIDRTDVTPGFVAMLKKEGHEARLLNALTDDFGTDYDLVFANAVLLHFSPEEEKKVLAKARSCLNDGGILAFSVKQGEGSEWSTEKINAPRQFYYWHKPALENMVKHVGFSLVEITEAKSRSASWYHVIAKKSS